MDDTTLSFCCAVKYTHSSRVKFSWEMRKILNHGINFDFPTLSI